MPNPPHSRSTIVAAVAACAGFITTAIGGVVLLVGQHDTQDALCRFAQRSADTKTLMIDTLADAFGVDEANTYIAAMRAGIADERDELDGYCPQPTETP